MAMSAACWSVVSCTDSLSGVTALLEDGAVFESCKEDLRNRKLECSVPFTWCLTNVRKNEFYNEYRSPLFRIDPRDERKYCMEIELQHDASFVEVRLFMSRDMEDVGKRTLYVSLTDYADLIEGGMKEIVRKEVTFLSNQLRLWILQDICVGYPARKMDDLLVIHIGTDGTVGVDEASASTLSSLPGGFAGEQLADMGSMGLAEDMKRLLRETKFSDVILRSEGRDIRAHRSILSGRSAVFESMFRQPMKESEDGLVDVADVAFDTLQRLVTYMYCGRLTERLTHESVIALFVASDKYDVYDLRDSCAEVILKGLNVENCAEVLMLADSHGHVRLKEMSGRYFADHYKEISRRPDWAERLKTRPDLLCELMGVLAGHVSSF